MSYVLKRAGGEVIATSQARIFADIEADVFRTAEHVWHDPRPSDDGYTEQVDDEPVVVVPVEVQRRQALKAIYLQLGKTKADLLALADAQTEPTRTLMLIDIEESNTFRRDNPTLLALAGALGLTPSQVDDLFVFADTLA